jgi:L-threonylcarbamoyladenylate synthase
LHPRLDAAAIASLPTDEAVLLLRRPASLTNRDTRIHWLSETGSLADIARGLFAALRALDAGDWKRLHAEFPTGQEGLAPAIRDRLTRAAAKR